MKHPKKFFSNIEVSYKFVLRCFPNIDVSYKFVLNPAESLNEIFWANEYLHKTGKCKILSRNTKHFSGKTKQGKVSNFPKNFSLFCSFLWICFAICQKLNSNLLSDWILVQDSKCKIWSTNTKPFFWERVVNFETSKKLSRYFLVSYKLILKSVKSLNQISRAIEYWFKTGKYQIC